MKKMMKLVSLLLAMALLAIPFPVYANESMSEPVSDIKQGGISQTIQSLHESAPQETYPVIIWLEDIDTTKAVAAATSKIPNFETRSNYLAATARMTAAESEEYNHYIDVKRDAMRSCYEAYTNNFANSYLHVTETIYCSKYLPFITAELSYARIKALASCPEVEAIGYDAEDEWDETLEPVDSPLSSTSIPPQYYTIADTIEDMGIDDIWADGAEGQSVNVGIIDVGIPNVGHTVFSGLTIYTQYAYSQRPSVHASAMLEIISCMAPEATFYNNVLQYFLDTVRVGR